METELQSALGGLQQVGRRMADEVRGTRLVDLALNAIEITDRNLYERTCDVRWWATDAAVVEAARHPAPETLAHASRRLAVILGAYTVYLDLWICDASGRVLAGGVAVGLPISVWLLAFSLFIFFSLAAVKRQAELVDAVRAGKLQIVGRGYHPDDLELVSQLATASGLVSVLVMTLYLSSDTVTQIYTHPQMLWGVTPVLLFWISRVIFKAHRGEMHDDPIVFAAKDKVSMICGVLVFGFAVAATLP
jgi:hypothetical protein